MSSTRRGKTGTIPVTVVQPWGEDKRVMMYIKRKDTSAQADYTAYLAEHLTVKRINEVWTITGKFEGIDTAQKLVVKKGNTFKLFSNHTLYMKGEFTKVTYNSNLSANFEASGVTATKMKRVQSERLEYTNTPTSTIVTALAGGVANVTVGTNDNFGNVTIRAEYTNYLNAIRQLADKCIDVTNQNKYNWYESWGTAPYDTDYINFDDYEGSTSSQYTFSITGSGSNIIKTTRSEDIGRLANEIYYLGYGDGVNQLKTRIFHATNNRTYLNGGDAWLTAAIAIDATSCTVNSNAGFTVADVIKIDDEEITLSGVDGDGVTLNFTADKATAVHADNSDVINTTAIKIDDSSDFPAAVADKVDGGITDSDTSIDLTDASDFDDYGYIQIGTEIIFYESKSSNTLTVPTGGRGWNGTTAAPHLDEAVVTKLNPVWVGAEFVYYTIIGSNKLSGLTRGASYSEAGTGSETDTDAYAHGTDIEIYDGLYWAADAETDSSIDTNDRVTKRFSDTALIDQNMLDLAAQRQLIERKDPIEIIKLFAADPFDVIDNVEVGDIVTVTDANVGLTAAEKRVVGMMVGFGGGFHVRLDLANKDEQIVTQMVNTADKTEKLDVYMQGAPSILPYASTANADKDNGITIDMYFPSEVVKINKVLLKYRVDAFRSFTLGTSGATPSEFGAHNHTTDGHFHTMLKYVNDTPPGSTERAFTGKTTTDGASVMDIKTEHGEDYYTYTQEDTVTNGGMHGHKLQAGIDTTTFDVGDFTIKVDGVDKTIEWKALYNSFSTTEGSRDAREIPTSWFSKPITGWHTITLTPVEDSDAGQCWLDIDVNAQIFLVSK